MASRESSLLFTFERGLVIALQARQAHALEKEMATHSSVLAWRIPGTGDTAWQDEALARDGISREVPCSALKGETVPDKKPEKQAHG